MTKVECTVCSEIVEITASTISLPFVCADCEKRAEQLVEPSCQCNECLGLEPTEPVLPCVPLPTGDSVEAATEMLNDMQTQLQNAKDDLAAYIEKLTALEFDYQESQAEVARLTRELNTTQEGAQELAIKFSEMSYAVAKAALNLS